MDQVLPLLPLFPSLAGNDRICALPCQDFSEIARKCIAYDITDMLHVWSIENVVAWKCLQQSGFPNRNGTVFRWVPKPPLAQCGYATRYGR